MMKDKVKIKRKRLTPEEEDTIKVLLKEGKTHYEIAEMFKISRRPVYRIHKEIGREEEQFKENIPDTLYSYLAGIIDGEGTIGIQKSKRKENRSGCSFIPYIAVTNTYKPVLELLVDTLNFSSIREHSGGNKNRLIQNKVCYRTYVSRSSRVKFVITKLLPYLKIKKEQALCCLEIIKLKEENGNYSQNTTGGDQFDLYIKCRQLNGADLSEDEINSLKPMIRDKKQPSVNICTLEHNTV